MFRIVCDPSSGSTELCLSIKVAAIKVQHSQKLTIYYPNS